MSPVRRSTALAGAVFVLGSVGATQAFAATAKPASVASWVATATKAYNTFGSKLLGATPADRSLNLVISLEPRDSAAEAAALKAMYTPGSATYHQFLTPAQFAAQYGAAPTTVNAVSSYLGGLGFTNISVLD